MRCLNLNLNVFPLCFELSHPATKIPFPYNVKLCSTRTLEKHVWNFKHNNVYVYLERERENMVGVEIVCELSLRLSTGTRTADKSPFVTSDVYMSTCCRYQSSDSILVASMWRRVARTLENRLEAGEKAFDFDCYTCYAIFLLFAFTTCIFFVNLRTFLDCQSESKSVEFRFWIFDECRLEPPERIYLCRSPDEDECYLRMHRIVW